MTGIIGLIGNILRCSGERPWRRLPKDIRYLGVGLACAVVNNVLLISLSAAGVGVMAASLLALGPTLLIGYGLHVAVTFEAKSSSAAFLRYSAGIIAGYPVWLGTLFLLCDMLKLSVVVAGPLGTLLMFLWNYALTHWAFLGSNNLTMFLRLRRRRR